MSCSEGPELRWGFCGPAHLLDALCLLDRELIVCVTLFLPSENICIPPQDSVFSRHRRVSAGVWMCSVLVGPCMGMLGDELLELFGK